MRCRVVRILLAGLFSLSPGCIETGKSNKLDDLSLSLAAGYVIHNHLGLMNYCGPFSAARSTYSVASRTITVDGLNMNSEYADSGGSSTLLTTDAFADSTTGSGSDISFSNYIAKSSTHLFLYVGTQATPTGTFKLRLRPPGGNGTTDDVITLFPASSCGGAVATSGVALEASMPFSTCFPSTGASRTSVYTEITSSGDAATCITTITW